MVIHVNDTRVTACSANEEGNGAMVNLDCWSWIHVTGDRANEGEAFNKKVRHQYARAMGKPGL